MSQKRITKLLKNLGFSNLDTIVYIFIAKLGPLSKEEIGNRLGIESEQLNQTLKNLTEKRVITLTQNKQPVYTALAFESLIDEYIKLEIKQAEDIKKNHQQLISTWRSLTKMNEE